jgi:outer membrane receptor for ferrienterochelin and colicins
VKGGVMRGYKTPTLNQLHDGISGVSGQGTILTIGTPDLEPETTTNTEFGVYYDNLHNFNANVTFFHNKFEDKIDGGTAIPNCFSTDPDVTAGQSGCIDFGAGFTQGSFAQITNIGKAETQGSELGSRWEFAPAWTLSANYTYTDSEQKSGLNKGAPLTNTPDHLFFARVNWAATQRINVWLKGEYRSERARFTDRYENLSSGNQALQDATGDLKAYEVFHLGGSLQATDDLMLNATIYNVLGRDFTEGSYYTTNAGVTGWASDYIQSGRSTDGTLEEGRRLWLSATYQF